jgi:hypothetical protein
MIGADFDKAYRKPILMAPVPSQFQPACKPSNACFIGSYPPITHAGYVGPYFVNTYYLEGDRKRELGGPVVINSAMFARCNN